MSSKHTPGRLQTWEARDLVAAPPPPRPALSGALSESGVEAPAGRNTRVTSSREPQNEPSAAVNPLNPGTVIITANDYREGDTRVGLYRSTNGGASFDERILPLPSDFDAGGDGVVAAGFKNRFLVVGLAYNRPRHDGTVLVWRSLNDGDTFSEPIVVNEGAGMRIFNDKPWIAIDRGCCSPYVGQSYVSYTRFINEFSSSVIFFQRSANDGATWSTPVRLSEPGAAVQGSNIAVGPEGEVYVAWIQFAPGRPRFILRRSDDGGRTFRPAVSVAQITPPPRDLPVPEWEFKTPTFAYLAADLSGGQHSGTLYAVWQDYRMGDSDIFLARSTTRGDSWTPPARINDSPSGVQDFFPAIDVDPESGKATVIYYTNRVEQELLDVFAAESSSGGVRWERNRRLTDRSFDPNADSTFQTPSRFIGDYISVAAAPPDGIVGAWTDTRMGSQDIFAGDVPRT